ERRGTLFETEGPAHHVPRQRRFCFQGLVIEDLDGWDKFYRCVVEETIRQANERLDRFRVSLGDWLHPQLNWPTEDWQQQLDLFVEHTRYYGLIIEPECVQTLHDLLEARVNGTGAFAALGPYDAQQKRAATDVPIQVAAAVALDQGSGVVPRTLQAQDERRSDGGGSWSQSQEHLELSERVTFVGRVLARGRTVGRQVVYEHPEHGAQRNVEMTVYVDDMRAPFGRMVMCHMIADTSDELHAMARSIGVRRKWCQSEGTSKEHYDICLRKREEAVELGAVEITWTALGRMLRGRSRP
ncbi:hypothetical protein LCGC14_3064530, partial [marine sediment metagenome]